MVAQRATVLTEPFPSCTNTGGACGDKGQVRLLQQPPAQSGPPRVGLGVAKRHRAELLLSLHIFLGRKAAKCPASRASCLRLIKDFDEHRFPIMFSDHI